MRWHFLFFASCISQTFALAQAGSNDASFNTFDSCHWGDGNGFNSFVYDCAIQPDGKIVAIGLFSAFNNNAAPHIIRLNSDGTRDETFQVPGTGFGGAVPNDVEICPNGKIVVCGNFTDYNGTPVQEVVVLNTDGSLDLSFISGTGFNNAVNTIAIQTDGKILAAGDFTTYNGTPAVRIVRLNPDGTVDPSFISGSGFNGDVLVLEFQNDGKIIAGGDFGSYNGAARTKIARVNTDGSNDATFTPIGGFNGAVTEITLQPDNKVLVGGGFTTFNSISRSKIARLNSNGLLDNTFNPGTGFDNGVNSIVVLPDSRIIAGGHFNVFNGVDRESIACLNSDGTLDNSMFSGLLFDFNVRSVQLLSDGKLITAGDFSSYNEISAQKIARLNADGSIDEEFNQGSGFERIANVAAVLPDQKILVGGYYTSYNGTHTYGLARLHPDGEFDSTFFHGADPGGNISEIFVLPDGKILIGGGFYEMQGVMRYCIARLNEDGTVDTTFNPNGGFDDDVYAIDIQSDGKIIVGGRFTSFNSIPTNYIARLNVDGSLDTTFQTGTGFDHYVYDLLITDDNKILAGGSFTQYNGYLEPRLVRLTQDGFSDNLFVHSLFLTVYSIAEQNDNKFIIAGNKIYRIHPDGETDTTFDSGPTTLSGGEVRSVLVQDNGKIVIGGYFNQYNGTSCNGIARLRSNGMLDTGFDSGSGFDDGVRCIVQQNDSSIIAVGDFHTYNNFCRTRIARIDGGCLTNISINQDGGTLTAANAGASYQWVNCDSGFAHVVGATQQSFTPVIEGNYAAIITEGTCQDTSNCIGIFGLEIQETDPWDIKFYPNPTNGNLTFENLPESGKIEILTMPGTLIQTVSINDQQMKFDCSSLESGTYIVRVYNDDQIYSSTFIVLKSGY